MRLFLVSAIALAFCVPAFAGVSDYEFTPSDIEGAEGATVTSTLSFEFADGADAIDGWQFAVCHDPDFMTLDGVTSLEIGDPDPAFEGIVEDAENGLWRVGAIYSFGSDTLSEDGDAYDVDYILGVPGTGSLDVCDTDLDSDGVSVAVGGISQGADGNSADVTILSPFTYSFSDTCGGYDASTGEGTGYAILQIVEDPVGDVTDVNAFTVAVSSDSNLMTPTGAVEGEDLEDPGYFSASTTADSCVVAVIINLSDFNDVMTFDEAKNVVQFDYETNSSNGDFDGTDDPVVADVEFEDTDEVNNEVAAIIDDAVATIVPNLENSSIEWTDGEDCGGGGGFLRGDCDGNGVVFPILDALYVLEYGFTNGPIPPCLAAADCDGNGIVFPILDALYVLEYGFTNGPAPPDPGPTLPCGPDTNSPGPGCETIAGACL